MRARKETRCHGRSGAYRRRLDRPRTTHGSVVGTEKRPRDPLSHVVGAEVSAQEVQRWWQGVRTGGTHMPGVITAGTFYQEGERVFWDVHDPQKTVVIQLRDERYARLVIGVEDPPATVAAIQEALGA